MIESFRGEVSVPSIIDIIQIYTQNNLTAKISLVHFDDTAEIYIMKGNVVHVETNLNFGVDAFYEIIRWTHGKFKVYLHDEPSLFSISKNWMELALEAYVLLDSEEK